MVRIYALYETGTTEIRYVGKTIKTVTERLNKHLYSSLKGKCYKSKWINSVNFRISIKTLAIISDDDWEYYEQYFINKVREAGHRLTNLTNGGNGAGPGIFNPMYGVRLVGELNGMFGKTHSDKSREKISKNHSDVSGEKNPNFGKKRSLELREKLSRMNKGKKHTEESKRKISEKLSGENNPFFGKKHTEETKKLLRSLRIKKVEKLDKITEEVLEEFPSLADAQSSVEKGNIGDCCRGKQKTAAGFKWRFKKEKL